MAERDSIRNLAAATADMKREHPLPRCEHEHALRDHANDVLEPPCGCRLMTKSQLAAALAEQREQDAVIADEKEAGYRVEAEQSALEDSASPIPPPEQQWQDSDPFSLTSRRLEAMRTAAVFLEGLNGERSDEACLRVAAYLRHEMAAAPGQQSAPPPQVEKWVVECLTCSGTDHLSERHQQGNAFWHKFTPHPILLQQSAQPTIESAEEKPGAAEQARIKALFRAIEILNHVPLSIGNQERDAWGAIREAIKGIEAEI